jgi:hypothetical protein
LIAQEELRFSPKHRSAAAGIASTTGETCPFPSTKLAVRLREVHMLVLDFIFANSTLDNDRHSFGDQMRDFTEG